MSKRDAFSEINITPLTDIFLVLLIIMMVVAPLLEEQGLNLMVPTNVETKSDKKPKILIIKVSTKGQYTCDRKEIMPDQLTDFIKEKALEYKDGILIQADGDATHGAVVKVMDAARNAGVKDVSLADY